MLPCVTKNPSARKHTHTHTHTNNNFTVCLMYLYYLVSCSETSTLVSYVQITKKKVFRRKNVQGGNGSLYRILSTVTVC
jgi:hypothetical protein